ncbi:hypothetical protein CANCADRAFT_164 [Tortispora caseinolytica NRRL Y-17796]|uniref:EamA domain-containing protein n=1 Tax=Tortispora caseinolytica NRRL Y-17796 TaxID=767744 RepID=A0A1E4TIU2_9ASCO|nr:hypothetical protein CANCADRAFT_164 [Tortispora caseinolytica NRRL Y-17796]
MTLTSDVPEQSAPTVADTNIPLKPAESESDPQNWFKRRCPKPLYKIIVSHAGLKIVALSQLFGSFMSVSARLLETRSDPPFHPLQILFTRMVITSICSLFYMYKTKVPKFLLGPPEVRGLLLARGITGFFGVFGLYYSLNYLSLSEATVITFLNPAASAFACYLLLNEPFTRKERLATVVSLIGVIIIAKPGPLALLDGSVSSSVPATHSSNSTMPAASPSTISIPAESAVSSTDRYIAIAVALLGVCGAAGAFTCIRWIGKRAHPLITVNYFAVWCVFVSTTAIIVLPGMEFLFPSNFTEWALLIAVGVSGFLMQFLLTIGLQLERPGRATNMLYLSMFYALAFDKLIWGQTPTWMSIIGSALILGSAVWVALQKDTGATAVAGSSDAQHPRNHREDLEDGSANSQEAMLLDDFDISGSESESESELESHTGSQADSEILRVRH